jgi:hypothetical protein
MGGEGKGSRRVQLTAVALMLILDQPSLAWPVACVAAVCVAALTVTDLASQ